MEVNPPMANGISRYSPSVFPVQYFRGEGPGSQNPAGGPRTEAGSKSPAPLFLYPLGPGYSEQQHQLQQQQQQQQQQPLL